MLKTVGNPSTRYGDQTVVDGNLVIGTAGKGIDFSADPSAPGMTSELLDDYEEGTWTVTLYDAASGGNASPTTGTGYYTKVGNMVHCSFFLDNINTTGMTAGNALYISLPFTSSASLGRATGSVILNEVAFAAGRTQQNVYVGAATSRATIQESGSGVSRVSMTVGAFTSGSDDIFTFDATYFV